MCARSSAADPSHPNVPFFISESHYPQVSHHPPISAFYYVSPANKVAIVGELRPKSKFLGNSVSTVMEGQSRITLMGRPEDSGKSIAYSSPFPAPPHEAKDAC
jgi:Oxysterol-binding protein